MLKGFRLYSSEALPLMCVCLVAGVLMRVSDWPGLLTWLGAGITFIGTLMVICHGESIEAIKIRITGVSTKPTLSRQFS